ncbi:hypothetical protein Tco_0558368 [Tanacetum coccineum]
MYSTLAVYLHVCLKLILSMENSSETSDEELEAPIEDQPLPTDASPTALSPDYIADFDPKKDEEDPEEDPADHPIDGGDNDDNDSFDDDDDDDDYVVKDEEEEEHLASADLSTVLIYDLSPQAKDTEAFETDESASTPHTSPHHIILFSKTKSRILRIHYKSECPIVKFQKRVEMIHGGLRASKPKTMQDAIEFVTKLMDKKISTPAERRAENKRKLV